MLQHSNVRRRYKPPNRMQVVQQSLLVYLYNAIVAALSILPYRWGVPHQTAAFTGIACLPVEYDTASTIFLFAVFLPLTMAIPLVYVLWICYDIYKRQLMPPPGRRRLLVNFFARIALVMLVMWVPFFLVFAIVATPWVNFSAGTWSHLQGAVTASFSLMKPDTKRAYLDLWWRCNWNKKYNNNNSGGRKQGGRKQRKNFGHLSSRLDSWLISLEFSGFGSSEANPFGSTSNLMVSAADVDDGAINASAMGPLQMVDDPFSSFVATEGDQEANETAITEDIIRQEETNIDNEKRRDPSQNRADSIDLECLPDLQHDEKEGQADDLPA